MRYNDYLCSMGNYIKKKTIKCPQNGCTYTSRIPIKGSLGYQSQIKRKGSIRTTLGHASYNCPIHRLKLI